MPIPPTSQLGRIVGGGRSYQITPDDVLWLARSVACEGGNPAATAWTYAWRYITKRFSGSFASMVRSHSQPVNPAWDEATDERCVSNPDHCTERALANRARCAGASWDSIPSSVRAVVLAWATARQQNPAPRATDFANAAVSRSFLNRNPDARVVLRAGNWYIAEQPSLPADHVVIEYGGRVAGPTAAAGGAILLGAAVFAGWAYWRSRQKRGRGLSGVVVNEYETPPRAGARRPVFCKTFKVRVSKDCMSSHCDVIAEAESRFRKPLGAIEASQNTGSPFLTVRAASVVAGGTSMDPNDPDNYVGCGIGTRLYEALASYACDEGLILRSDVELSDYSRSFWEKQVAKGRAYPDGERLWKGKIVPERYVIKSSKTCSSRIDLSGARGRRRGRR